MPLAVQHLLFSLSLLGGRTRGYVKRGLETDLNGQKRVPLLGRESRRSVQAQDPYNLPAQAAALEQTLSRLKRVSGKDE